MFAIGDYVFNQKTEHVRKVIGYGHQIHNGVYTPTLKVLVAQALNSRKKGFVEEDLHSMWAQWPEAAIPNSNKSSADR